MNSDDRIEHLKRMAEEENKARDELFNPLAKYSDSQLKGEFKRRKKIKDSTELSGGVYW